MCFLLRCFPDIQLDKVAVVWNLATLIAVLFLAAATQTVKVDLYPLRSGCEQNDPIVTRLHAGDPVRIKFSLAGRAQPFYVISPPPTVQGVGATPPAHGLSGRDDLGPTRRGAGHVRGAAAPAPH